MARATALALESGQHLLVQAGTGVGKSLAYLVPALVHAVKTNQPVLVATATLALQRQIMEKDLPLALDAVKDQLERPPKAALLMGRANYLCRSKVAGDYPSDQESLFDLDQDGPASTASPLAKELRWVNQWAKQTVTGQRDSIEGGVTQRAWRRASVSGLECTGSKCPYLDECFAELARDEAGQADLVVTNHAMLALHLEGQQVLPEFGAVVIDEAHQLTASITRAQTSDLDHHTVARATRACDHLGVSTADLEKAGQALAAALETTPEGWLRGELPEPLDLATAALQAAARSAITAANKAEATDAARQQALAALDQLREVCRRLAPRGTGGAAGSSVRSQVVWCSTGRRDREQDPSLHVAPLSVAAAIRDKLLAQATAIMTSATLTVGDSFHSPALAAGLLDTEEGEIWRGLQAASPFDYQAQAIFYVAKHLPAPSREGRAGMGQYQLMAQLIDAANGGALGLFTAQAAAEAAAAAVRPKVDYEVLCQGETSLAALVDQFLAEEDTCLFGTMSLWQGLDAPGSTCRLVMIDRLPFPRPDDPLVQARQQAAARAGRNAFMEVAASQAATLLAQGVGRLIRNSADQGLVAVLDSRLATARYGPFLRAGLPPMWQTTELDQAIASLGRLGER